MTLQVQLVLGALLADPAAERYGLQLCADTGLPSGTIYPIMARLERLGWVESSWEAPSRHVAEGRPRRRYYRLSGDGVGHARAALARARGSGRRIQADLVTGTGIGGVTW
jgi:PadR family transcriptional regulator PadR